LHSQSASGARPAQPPFYTGVKSSALMQAMKG